MATETVESLIEGGKATAAPPLGPALGPLKVNIGEVVKAINDKTAGFKGMQVPVKVTVDTDTKEFEIEVGTPPATALIKKEAGIQKGSGNPLADKVADLKIEQIIKISKMKEDSLTGADAKKEVKEIIGTCSSMGVMVEGMPASEAMKAVDEGRFDSQINSGKTEITVEEQKELEEERRKLAAEAEQRHAEEEKTAKAIVAEMKNKPASSVKAKLTEAGISTEMITKVMAEVAPEAEKKE